MRGLSLDQLRAFALVVDKGGFSAAAEYLNLTQPAVSLQIRQLERRLGVRLIERVGRRARPTAAGHDFLCHARRVEEAVAAALESTVAHRAENVGRVRLGTGATACIYLLPPILRDLRTRMPQLEIVVSTGNTPDVLRFVDENRIDAALVTLPAPGRMFQVTPVQTDELVAVFPAGEAPSSAKAIKPDVLVGRPLIFYEADGHTRRVIDDWFMKAGLAANPVMELGNVEAIKELVGAGLGSSILPAPCVSRSDSRPALAARPLAPALHRSLGLVMRRDKALDRGLREVVRALTSLSAA